MGGDPVRIEGARFVNGGALAFSCNGIALTNVIFVSATLATATAPAQATVTSPTQSFSCSGTNGNGVAIPTAANAVTYDWDPSQLGDVVWWVRSDYGVTAGAGPDGGVSSWKPIVDNASVGAARAVQETAAQRPTYAASAIHGLPAIYNDAVASTELHSENTFASPLGGTTGAVPFSISVVAQATGTATAGTQYVFVSNRNGTPTVGVDGAGITAGEYGGGGPLSLSAGETVTSPFLATVAYGQTATVYFNGTSAATGPLYGISMTGIVLMANWLGSDPSQGYLAEVVIENAAIASEDEVRLHTYAHAFWGTP
jgi:hypothetical protein